MCVLTSVYFRPFFNSFIIQTMSETIEEKSRLMNVEIQASDHLKSELLELIRTTPAYFNQFLAHVGNQKIQEFLDKDEKYRNRKILIEKMKEEIFEDQMRLRESQVRFMNLPDTFRRACVSPTCAICLSKHEWTQIMMLTCGHVFHGHCVKELRKSECPVCRTKILFPRTAQGIFGEYINEDV